MNTILTTIINSARFVQADGLWAEELGEAVLTPFFACFVANLSQSQPSAWYQDFIHRTRNNATLALQSHEAMIGSDAYWQNTFHVKLKEHLAKDTGADEEMLYVILPLATHTGYEALSVLARQQGMSVHELAQQTLPDITPQLPIWAHEVVAKEALVYLKTPELPVLTRVDESLQLELDNNELKADTKHEKSLFAQPMVFGDLEELEPKLDEASPQLMFDDLDLIVPDEGAVNDTIGNDNEMGKGSDGDVRLSSLSDNPSIQPSIQKSTTQQNAGVVMRPPVTPRSKKPKQRAILAGLGAGLVLAMAGAGVWYYKGQKNSEPVTAPTATSPAPVSVANPSHLSITVGQAGELYACQAQVGTDALSSQVLELLQKNFANTVCVIDINEQAAPTMAGFERLTSVIALLKSVPFASIELKGNTMYVNAPNASDVTRLVQDLGALMTGTGVSVVVMPPLDRASAINDSLALAQDALTKLAQNSDDYALARALSLQVMDMSQGGVPEANKALLQQAAEYFKKNPSAHLMIVVHSDDTGNATEARMQTQMQAETIKNHLVSLGVGAHQLSTVGVGFDYPISDNQTELGRFKNRRVEFLVYSDAVMQTLSMPRQATTAEAVPTETLPATSGMDVEVPTPEAATAEPVLAPAQPIYDVQNGQIVEQGQPTPASTTPINNGLPQGVAPSGGIPNDLLNPIGADPAGTGVSDGQVTN